MHVPSWRLSNNSGLRRGWAREHPRSLIGDGDRVLEVRGHRAIFSHGRPFIVEDLYLRGPGVYHGFDGDDKAALEPFPRVWRTEVRDLRLLVHLPAGAVAHELMDDRIAA